MPIITCGPHCVVGQGSCTDPQVAHEGLVLGTYDRNLRTDSDMIAAVWNPAAQQMIPVQYGTTRWWTYHNTATPDAPTDVVEAARAWLTFRVVAAARDLAERDVRRGDAVKSITTRGRNKGLVGTVRRLSPSRYGGGHVALVVTRDDEQRWIDIERLRVSDPARVAQECRRAAAQVQIADSQALAQLFHRYAD